MDELIFIALGPANGEDIGQYLLGRVDQIRSRLLYVFDIMRRIDRGAHGRRAHRHR